MPPKNKKGKKSNTPKSGSTPSNSNGQQGTSRTPNDRSNQQSSNGQQGTPNTRNPSVRPTQQSSNGQQGTPNTRNPNVQPNQPTVERGNLPQNGDGATNSQRKSGGTELQPGTSKTKPPQAKRNSPKKEPQQRNDFPAIGGLSLKESSQNGAQKNQQNTATPQSSGGKRSKSKRVSQDPQNGTPLRQQEQSQNAKQNGNQAKQQNRPQLNEPSAANPWGAQRSAPTNGGPRTIDPKGPQSSAWGTPATSQNGRGSQQTQKIKSNEVKSHNGTPTTSLSSAQERPRGPPIKAAEPSTCKMGSTSTSSSNTSIPLKCADAEKAEISIPKLDSVTAKKIFRLQQVFVNYLPVSLKKLPDYVYHYDFQIVPDKPKKMIEDAFMTFMKKNFPKYANMVAFDGVHNFYSAKKLPQEECVDKSVRVVPRDGGGAKDFEIKIQFATEIDMKVIKDFPTDQPVSQAIQCLDVVLRAAADNSRFLRFKRSIFLPAEKKEYIRDTQFEIWVGLFQSFILGSKPFLNVDVSHKAFPIGGNLYDLYRNMRPNDLEDLLKGTYLIYHSPITNQDITYKYNSIRGPANRETFVDDTDKRRKTIAEYFHSRGHGLRNPEQPVCHVGNPTKKILLPITFLTLPDGQAVNRRAPDCCTQGMVRFAATSTDIRKGKIMHLVNQMNYNNCEVIKAFGIAIDKNFTEVTSHILTDRQVMYKNGSVMVNNGSWRADKQTYLRAANAVPFGVLNLNSRQTQMPAIMSFVDLIEQISRSHGVQLNGRNVLIENYDYRHDSKNLENIMYNFKADGVKLLFVIIPRDDGAYQKVKQVAELRCGILTQCIKSDTIYKKGKDPATIDNILLKVNAKLAGTNHRVADDAKVKVRSLKGPWMVVGADVTHPSPQETTIPSVVGVAASCDVNGFKYNCEWRLQNPKDEMIRDLENVMVSLLKKFKETNNRFPNYILYYRDGVSDGQFKEVTEVELCAIQKACKRLQTEPKVTFIVVQKRHHTRFFPRQPNTMDRKNNNVVPGTVVDSVIVNPLIETFFMVSHQSLQGVAKPTKYCVLHDDADIPSEELQVFTYGLCHLFARCNRVVSYPAPTYYGHLVAFRGRVYIHGVSMNFDDLEGEYNRRRIHQDVINNNPMFFV